MIKLIQNGLFGENLIALDSSVLVERYNDCLRDIGLKETSLQSFHIDGWGWSPEIAEEQGNRFYLSHGFANHYGIIISPKQKTSSVYMPVHSFDWDIHHQVFDHYFLQIEDLTTTTAIWFELDQDISIYRKPEDLLMMDVVNITFHSTKRLTEAAREQKALVRRFNEEKMSWSDRSLLEELIESSKKHGDLRYRKFDLPTIPFANISSYYTEAFKGVYVFRKTEHIKPFLVHSDNSLKDDMEIGEFYLKFNISNEALTNYLIKERIIGLDPFFLKEHLYLLDLQKEYIFQKAISESMPDLDPEKLNSNQLKGVLSELNTSGKIDDRFFLLEETKYRLQQFDYGGFEIPLEIEEYLLHPLEHVGRQEKIVIWQLLGEALNSNPILIYLFNKPSFYTAYKNMPETIKSWVVKSILANRSIFHELIK